MTIGAFRRDWATLNLTFLYLTQGCADRHSQTLNFHQVLTCERQILNTACDESRGESHYVNSISSLSDTLDCSRPAVRHGGAGLSPDVRRRFTDQ